MMTRHHEKIPQPFDIRTEPSNPTGAVTQNALFTSGQAWHYADERQQSRRN